MARRPNTTRARRLVAPDPRDRPPPAPPRLWQRIKRWWRVIRIGF